MTQHNHCVYYQICNNILFNRYRRVRCDRSSSRRMRDSGIESEADTDVFHARVINAWSEDADEDFFENNS